jgi:hypothetical protein
MKNRLRFQFLANFLLLSILLLNGCKTSAPTGPTEAYKHSANNYPKSLSYFNLPLEISLTKIEGQINKELKGLLYEENTLDSKNSEKHHIKIWKKGDVELTAVDEDIFVKVPLRIWAKGALNLEKFGINSEASKDVDFETNLLFKTRLEISDDWTFKTNSKPNGIEWVKKPTLSLGFFNVPIASLLEPMILSKQKEIAAELDSRIGGDYNVKDLAKKAWLQMQDPILLNQEMEAWLKIDPMDLAIKPFKGNGKDIGAIISLNGHTETIIGKKPEAKMVNGLPKLKISNASAPSDLFEISIPTEISHEKATQLAKDELLNKTFYFKNGKKKVTITDLHMYGHHENIVIKAGLKGDLNGVIFLKGEPYYNEEEQSISLKNLDFDLDTKNKLHKTASWLLHGKFAKEMEKSLKVPVEKEMTEAKKLISSNISNRYLMKGVKIEGKLLSFMPEEFYITSESFITVLKAKGKAKVVVGEE